MENGKPPFPYVYNRLTKELEVNEEQLKIYDLLKKLFLDDQKRCYEISILLNKMGSRTAQGKYWSETAVHRILNSEVHLGKVIYGRTSGSGHKNKPNAKGVKLLDRNNWIVEEGSHHPLKTYEEHERIRAMLESRKITPRTSRSTVQVLNKLLYCGICGGSLQFLNRSSGTVHIKKCQKSDPFGTRCSNSGADVEVVYAKLHFDLAEYQERLMSKSVSSDTQDNTTLQIALNNKKAELEELVGGLDRIQELYIDGRLDKAKFKDRTDKQERRIQSEREEIANLEKSLAIFSNVRTDDERLDAIAAFKEAWNAGVVDNAELNRLARALIDRIDFVRQGDNIEINTRFL
jgi:site-specific DNA recombinase